MVGFGLVNIFGREIVKAESIEQIREHLEKGGRVIDSDDREVFTKCNWPWLVKDLTSEELANWTLLPLEEKEPETVASDKIEAAGRLVKFIREYSSGQCRILSIGSACECPLCDVGRLLEEKEPVDHGTQKGPASVGQIEAQRKRLERELAEFKALQGTYYPDGTPSAFTRVKDRRIKELEAELAALPDGTQKGQEERDWSGVYPKDCYAFRDSQKERMQRIRQRLLHGQWPEMSDLMDWWEATTGERIEWGKRCKRCDGTGKVGRDRSRDETLDRAEL